MNELELVRLRLDNHQLARPVLTDVIELVARMGAVQAQDYTAAKWGLGQRLRAGTDAEIEDAFNSGRLLRTHVLRPTWHFVTPADIRWMLALTSGRVRNAVGYHLRQEGFGPKRLSRAHAVIAKALSGGTHLTRSELAERLARDRAVDLARPDASLLMGNILGLAELDALICSGPRRGKQFTYALLDERVPAMRALDRAEALSRLTRRYYESHGPATLKDFVWWSGLTMTDARAGIEAGGAALVREEIDGVANWRGAAPARRARGRVPALLLPNFDEYVVAYADRGALIERRFARYVEGRSTGLFSHAIVLDGRIEGLWRRAIGPKVIQVQLKPFSKPTPDSQAALKVAIARFARFTGLQVTVPPASRPAK